MRSVLLTLVILLCGLLSCDWFDDPVQANLPPETEFTDCVSGAVTEGEDITFSLSGSDIDGTVVGYEWSYDDGDWVMTTADSVSIQGVTLGEHGMRARSVDDDGTVDPSPAECTFNVGAQGRLVERAVLVELLTATWCQYCPNSEEALNRLVTEYGPDRLCVIAYHDTPDLDDLATGETVARITWYTEDPGFPLDPGARPTVVFDGTRFSQGAETVGKAEAEYRGEIGARLQTGSPMSLRIEGDLGPATGSLTVTAKAEDLLPGNPIALHFAIIEDDVFSIGRTTNWFDFVVRDLLDSEILNLDGVGDSTVVERQFTIDGSWDVADLDVVVFAQDMTERRVIQSARLRVE